MPSKSSLHLTVTLTDGTVVDVHSSAADLMRYELHADRQKWPSGKDAPFLQACFVAWAAAKRKRQTELKWDAFFELVDDIDIEGGDSDPTDPDPEL